MPRLLAAPDMTAVFPARSKKASRFAFLLLSRMRAGRVSDKRDLYKNT
jgi:hypothetical protein